MTTNSQKKKKKKLTGNSNILETSAHLCVEEEPRDVI